MKDKKRFYKIYRLQQQQLVFKTLEFSDLG